LEHYYRHLFQSALMAHVYFFNRSLLEALLDPAYAQKNNVAVAYLLGGSTHIYKQACLIAQALKLDESRLHSIHINRKIAKEDEGKVSQYIQQSDLSRYDKLVIVDTGFHGSSAKFLRQSPVLRGGRNPQVFIRLMDLTLTDLQPENTTELMSFSYVLGNLFPEKAGDVKQHLNLAAHLLDAFLPREYKSAPYLEKNERGVTPYLEETDVKRSAEVMNRVLEQETFSLLRECPRLPFANHPIWEEWTTQNMLRSPTGEESGPSAHINWLLNKNTFEYKNEGQSQMNWLIGLMVVALAILMPFNPFICLHFITTKPIDIIAKTGFILLIILFIRLFEDYWIWDCSYEQLKGYQAYVPHAYKAILGRITKVAWELYPQRMQASKIDLLMFSQIEGGTQIRWKDKQLGVVLSGQQVWGKSPDALAMAFGHEIGHFIRGNTWAIMIVEKYPLLKLGGSAVIFIMLPFWLSPFMILAWTGIINKIYLALLRYEELQADRIMTRICLAAGFDPHKGFSELIPDNPSHLKWSDEHPAPEERLQRISILSNSSSPATFPWVKCIYGLSFIGIMSLIWTDFITWNNWQVAILLNLIVIGVLAFIEEVIRQYRIDTYHGPLAGPEDLHPVDQAFLNDHHYSGQAYDLLKKFLKDASAKRSFEYRWLKHVWNNLLWQLQGPYLLLNLLSLRHRVKPFVALAMTGAQDPEQQKDLDKQKDSNKKREKIIAALLLCLMFLILSYLISKLWQAVRSSGVVSKRALLAIYKKVLSGGSSAVHGVMFSSGSKNTPSITDGRITMILNKTAVKIGYTPFSSFFTEALSLSWLEFFYIFEPEFIRWFSFSTITILITVIKVVIKLRVRQIMLNIVGLVGGRLSKIFHIMFFNIFTFDIECTVTSYQYRMTV